MLERHREGVPIGPMNDYYAGVDFERTCTALGVVYVPPDDDTDTPPFYLPKKVVDAEKKLLQQAMTTYEKTHMRIDNPFELQKPAPPEKKQPTPPVQKPTAPPAAAKKPQPVPPTPDRAYLDRARATPSSSITRQTPPYFGAKPTSYPQSRSTTPKTPVQTAVIIIGVAIAGAVAMLL